MDQAWLLCRFLFHIHTIKLSMNNPPHYWPSSAPLLETYPYKIKFTVARVIVYLSRVLALHKDNQGLIPVSHLVPQPAKSDLDCSMYRVIPVSRCIWFQNKTKQKSIFLEAVWQSKNTINMVEKTPKLSLLYRTHTVSLWIIYKIILLI